jgi:hypothetical protein
MSISSAENKLRSNGISMVELLIASAIAAFLVMIALQLQKVSQKEMVTAVKEVENTAENLLTEKVIFNDIIDSIYSFNGLILQPEEPTAATKSFFDYQGLSRCVPSVTTECARTYSLNRNPTLQGKSKYFYLLVIDHGVKGSPSFDKIIYDPRDAYLLDAGGNIVFTEFPAGSGIYQTTWKGLNNNNKYSAMPKSPFITGQLLILHTNAPMVVGSVAYTLDYLGWVEDINVSKKPLLKREKIINDNPAAPNPFIFRITDPRPDAAYAGKDMASEKYVLDKMPSVPGISSLLSIQGVKVVRYYLKTTSNARENGQQDNELIRGELALPSEATTPPTYKERVVGHGIKQLIFTRDNISNPMIGFKLISDK